MGRTFDRSLLVGLGLILALLVVTAAQTYRNTWQLNEDAGWVTHTHEVLDLTADVPPTLVDAETGARGYIVSQGQDEYLTPYRTALTQLDQRLAALKDKTSADPHQQERIAQLQELITPFLATQRETVELRRKGVGSLGAYIRLIRQGKEQMDGIRHLFNTMEEEEHANLADRQQQTSRTYHLALATGLFTATLGLVMVGAFVWLLSRSLQTRQRAAAAVQEQREWFRTTLASIGDAVIATDTRGHIAFLNGVAETLTGWTQEEAQGQALETVFRIVNEESRKSVENPAVRALRQGQIIGLANHTLLIAKDGTERPIDDSAAPILSDHGHVAGAVLTFRDITERRRLEKEVQVRADELADADRRKNEFLAMLAHELRNPLAPIRNALHIMKIARGDAETFTQMQGIMGRQLTQMVRLVDDLLDVSRISRGKIDLRMERLDVARVVEIALETSRPLVEEAKHELTVALPLGPVSVVGDSTRLAQVLSNLLNNSAKYTPEGGHIALSVAQLDGQVAIRVRDDGIGIPADMLPGIFEMFTQADRSLHRAQGGLGIGLTLARRLIEMHGGSIEASSAGAGRGSEFAVRLPAVPGDEPTSSSEDGSAHSTFDSAVPAKPAARRILAVDDNADSVESLATLLRLLGHDVRTAFDGPSALAGAREYRPDLVLLDIGMPGMSGYEVARQMRTMPEVSGAMLVAQTGWGQDEDRRRSAEAGFDDHLVKPVSLADLQRVLAALRQPSEVS